MGTTGRFGGSGGLTSRGGHVWYDTDYSELYMGLAVVLGFFIFLVLFLIMMFGFIYLRRKCCAKGRAAVPHPTVVQQHRRSQNMILDQPGHIILPAEQKPYPAVLSGT